MSKRHKTIIIRKTTIYGKARRGNNNRKPQNTNNGCASIILILIAMLAFLMSGCSIEAPSSTNGIPQRKTVTSGNSQMLSATTSTEEYQIILFADHSGSMHRNGIPQLKKGHIAPLIKLIQENAGELVVGQINDYSKNSLARFLHKSSIPFPKRLAEENAKAFQKKIIRYQEKLQNLHKTKSNALYSIEEFNKKLHPILDYSSLAGSTDLSSAMELSKMIMNEEVGLVNPHKFLVLITDGIDSSNRVKFPPKLPPDVQLLVVNTNQKAHDLERYKHKKMTSIENAVRYILDH